ncbi:sigma factor-like helix-turn-helix DNA-binding protein [Rossellomorea sp. AcN35-11]|nr:RNA polymerase subunit sigma [Rossellomorea aquimaris]WJV29490.1 sigma factor-like helix-turn-helix DNA-binding protein [Rossellomorea sp. AcN35-11]
MQKRLTANRMIGRRNEEGMEDLVPKLYRYCYFLTKNKWDGEDLAQESIFKALSQYPDRRRWSSSLLNKIAYHVWIDKVRKQSRELIGRVPELIIEDQPLEGISKDMIQLLSNTMTPKQLVTFILKEAFQYKISEVATMLNMTETAVKALLNRSRARVKKISDEEVGAVQSFWDENLQEELNTILYRSLKAQDPSLLLAYLPLLLKHQVVQTLTPRTSPSPSAVLSSAA